MEATARTPILRKITTPLTTVTFAVVAVTGILMLFHIQDAVMRGPHEVFSILFVIASLTHLVLNWKPFFAHIRRRAFWICTGISLALAGITAVGAMQHAKDEVGPREVLQMMEAAPIDRLAPLLGTTPDEVIRRLESSGMEVSGPTASLQTVGEASSCSPREVLAAALRSSE